MTVGTWEVPLSWCSIHVREMAENSHLPTLGALGKFFLQSSLILPRFPDKNNNSHLLGGCKVPGLFYVLFIY